MFKAQLTIMILFLAELCASQSKGYIQIDSHENIHYVITDPLGRRTGADPRGIPADTLYKLSFLDEIPHAVYSFTSTGSLNPNKEALQEHEFVYQPISPGNDGLYGLTAIGVRLGTFYINAWINLPRGRSSGRLNVDGVIDKDSIVVYRFSYSDTSNIAPGLIKVISARSLLQDLAAMRKLNWITDQPTADKYANLITSYDNQLQQRDFNGAKTTLNSVIQNLVSDSSRTVSNDAYKSLRADIVQLLSQLPTPPPAYTLTLNILDSGTVTKTPDQTSYDSASRVQLKATPSIWYSTFSGWSRDAGGSTNPLFVTMNSNKTITAAFSLIPVSAMIDTLMAFKHQAQSKGWIGDANFVKELDNGLENARKHLAKRDSVNCGKELEDLQKKVKKEFEKESRKDKRFVTEDGYTLLYFSAQHIIGRLPRKK